MATRHAALAIVAASCSPSADVIPAATRSAPPQPSERRNRAELHPRRSARPSYLVGQGCFGADVPAPYLFPLFAKTAQGWTDDVASSLAALTATPQRFDVLGFDGERHGELVTSTVEEGTAPRGFVGSYEGVWDTGPCSFRLPDGHRGVYVPCSDAGGCGIAVASVTDTAPPGSAGSAPSLAGATLCVADGAVIGDLDRDGAFEGVPLKAFKDQASIQLAPYESLPCKRPAFAWYRQRVGGDVIDVLGAVDLDRDGHLELLIAFTPAGGPRSVMLYTTATSPTLRYEGAVTTSR